MIKAEDIKKLLTIDDYKVILESLGATIKSEDNKQIIFTSICHHINSNKHKAKLYFYKETKSFFCYSCSSSFDIFSLIQKRKELLGEICSFPQSIKYVCDICGIDSSDIKVSDTKTKCNWQSSLNKYIKHNNTYGDLKIYDKSVLNTFEDKYHIDWLNEGITIETMEKYNIKWYAYRNQIVIPCFDEKGNLIGIRARNMNKELIDEGIPKYFPLYTFNGSSYEFPTNQVFYGINYNLEEIKRTGVCWLVEGEKSVLKADSWFGEKNVALAMYGSNLGKKRFEEIVSWNLKELVIMLDSDFEMIYNEDETLNEEYLEFEDKIIKLAKPFKKYIDKVSICYNNQGYDGYKYSPFDFTKEEFEKLYEEREEI